jgi:hypothetical protein
MNCQHSEGSVMNISPESFPSDVYYCSLNTGMNRIAKSFVRKSFFFKEKEGYILTCTLYNIIAIKSMLN